MLHKSGRIYLLSRELARSKLVCRADQFPGDAGVGSVVAGIVDDGKTGAWPYPLELPRPADRRLKIEASVDHDAGNTGYRGGVADDAPVLEPRIVADVTRHDAREGERIRGVSESRRQSVRRRPGGSRGLPRAPRQRGLPANGGIGIVQQL